jgi:hypothetical protein
MASRQMAFQITELEIHTLLGRIARTYDLRDKDKTIGDWIDSIDPDPKVREKLQAVLVISIRCQKEGRDPLEIRKLICWRDPLGKPSQLEAEWKSGQKTQV